MSKLPMVNFKPMDKILSHLGFAAVRQKGSHVFYRHADGKTTTLPNHGNREIPDRSCARFFGKFPFLPMKLLNYSKKYSLVKASQPNTSYAGYFLCLKRLVQQTLKQLVDVSTRLDNRPRHHARKTVFIQNSPPTTTQIATWYPKGKHPRQGTTLHSYALE